MRHHYIKDPIFGATYTLTIGPVEKYNKYITRKFPKIAKKDLAVDGDSALYDDRKLPDGTKDRFIWLPEWVDDNDHMRSLAHEVDHAREEFFKYIGGRRTKASEEFYAYYSAWLLNECLTRLRKGKT